MGVVAFNLQWWKSRVRSPIVLVLVLGLATYMLVHALYVFTFKPSPSPETIPPREISPQWRMALKLIIGQVLAWVWWRDAFVFPAIDGLAVAFVAGFAENVMGAVYSRSERARHTPGEHA